MPNYSFECGACKHEFDVFLKMSENDQPTKEKCPKCGKKKVVKNWSEQKNSIAFDTTLTASKVNGGAWKEVIDRVKSQTPKRYHDKLEQSYKMNGGRYVR